MKQAAQAVDALVSASSVCVKVDVDPELLERVQAAFPPEMEQRPDDTADSLCSRINSNQWSEKSMVLQGGCGPARVQLKATTYPQPRRKTWSVVLGIGEAYLDNETQQFVFDAYYYKSRQRNAEDWKACPMPLSIFELGVQLWHVALPFIHFGPSKLGPPNGCQALCYYSLFNGAIPRHRDNFTTQQMIQYGLDASEKRSSVDEWMECLAVRGPDGEAVNSADIGSYVLIYTMGDAPMDFKLSFPPPGKRRAGRAQYEVHPLFTIRLSHGSLFIFSPLDDIFFCHEACFPDGAVGYRYALVFRWHSLQAQFFVHNNCMKLSEAQRAQQEQREREKQAKKKRARDECLKGPFG